MYKAMASKMPILFLMNAHARNKLGSVFISTCAVLSAQNQQEKLHIYSRLWKHIDKESTSKYLIEQVIYNKDGIVAINKPANMGSSKEGVSFYNFLPDIASKLGHKNLKIVSIPDKYTSGITILAASDTIDFNVSKSLRRSKALFSNNPKQSFLAVTVGHPIQTDNPGKYAVTKKFGEKGNHFVILRKWGQNEVKRREVNIGIAGHQVLAKSEEASLVSLFSWQTHNHFPRLILSDVFLSPALGDQKYGPRVASLFGKPVLLKPWLTPDVQALPPLLLQKLNLRSGSESLIPMHFHLHELTLSCILKDQSDLVLRAEPPDFFKWTCKQLNLEINLPSTILNQEDSNNTDKLGHSQYVNFDKE